MGSVCEGSAGDAGDFLKFRAEIGFIAIIFRMDMDALVVQICMANG